MTAPENHLIEVGDQPHEDVALCRAQGCSWRFRAASRTALMAAAYRHLADIFDPPTKETTA